MTKMAVFIYLKPIWTPRYSSYISLRMTQVGMHLHCVCMCVCACSCRGAQKQLRRGQRTILAVIPQLLSTLFMRQSLLLAWNSPSKQSWMLSKPMRQESLFVSPALLLQVRITIPGSGLRWIGVGRVVNSGPQAWKANTSLIKAVSPVPTFSFFWELV